MRALILLFAASALTASPALAQHQGHQMPMPMPQPAKKPAAKKPAAKKPVAKKAAAEKPAAKKAAPAKKAPAKRKPATPKPSPVVPHAGHTMPMETADPHAGHTMPQQSADPHAGHTMPMQSADPHAGHSIPMAMDIPVAPPPAAATSGPAHAADAVWGDAAMARGRDVLAKEHGGMLAHRFLVDRAEARLRRSGDGYLFDGQAWFGGDIDKLWLKSEVEGAFGGPLDHAEVQGLWSHAIGPFFDVQAGVRFDPQPGPNRTHAVLGVQGLAPYWWEVEGALFLSNKGELTARAEGEYDLRITQRLILQPRAEVDLSAQRVRELGFGSGLTSAELGLRLRYEFSPMFAPYVGVEYERAFGATARYRRADGERAGEWRALTGIRLWF